jgi:hypothetical protein
MHGGRALSNRSTKSQTLRWQRRALGLLLVPLVSLAGAKPVRAQPREQPDRLASFTTGASFGDGGTALALTAGLDFRLWRRVGLAFELAHARKLDFTLDLCPAPLVCVLGGQLPVTGRVVSLVPHVLVELWPDGQPFRVYALAGAGAGHVRQRYVFGPPFIERSSVPVEFTRSSLAVAISFGGGATLKVSRRLAAGLDVRVLSVRDEDAAPDRFITPSGELRTLRVGVRLVWRF